MSTARIPDGTPLGLHVGCHLPLHAIGCPDWPPRPRRACPEVENGKHTVAYYFGGLCDRCGDQLPIPRDELTP